VPAGEAKPAAVCASLLPGRGGELPAPPASTRVPHSLQNFTAGRSSAPQFSQARASAVPHSSQNFAPAGFSCAQDEQVKFKFLCDALDMGGANRSVALSC